MARVKSKTTSTPVWPDDRFKSETPGKAFTAYAERPFDPVWGIEQWGYEIHGQRGPQPFNRTDEHGDLVKAKGPDGRDIVQERFPDGNCNYEYETELRDVAVLTGTGPGRGTRHLEANAPDWWLPVGLTLRPPFSKRGQAMLREMGLAKRHSDTFEPLPDVLRAALLTTCHVATEMLSNLTGSQIETILRQHKVALGLTSETPATQPPEVGHSADFHSVRWHGQDFTFSHQQASVVAVLWAAYKNGPRDLGQETLLDKSGSSGGRLRDVFKEAKGMHPAWGTMITESRKGVFRLSEPRKKS